MPNATREGGGGIFADVMYGWSPTQMRRREGRSMAPNSIFRHRRRRRRHLDRRRRGVALLAFLESGESLRMNARGEREGGVSRRFVQSRCQCSGSIFRMHRGFHVRHHHYFGISDPHTHSVQTSKIKDLYPNTLSKARNSPLFGLGSFFPQRNRSGWRLRSKTS